MAKVDVYTLGQYGVNRVKSPIHVLDGELLNAQNAAPRTAAGQLAIGKRDGMAIINEDAAAGTLLGIYNIPFDSTIADFGERSGNACVTITDRNYRGGAWSPELGLFAVVGSSGAATDRVMTSPDGVTWTPQTTPATAITWQEICWSADIGLFCACGTGGTLATRIMTSPDGVTWTNQTAPAELGAPIAICAGDGKFVIISSDTNGGVGISTDGVNWSGNIGLPNSISWEAITYAEGLGLFCAVGSTTNTDAIATSSDGVTWTTQSLPELAGRFDIAYSPQYDRLVAVGEHNGGSDVYYSDNGSDWIGTDFPTTLDCGAVAWSPELGLFIATADDGLSSNDIRLSQDGITWHDAETNCALVNISDVIWSPALNKFLLTTLGSSFEILS